VEWLHQTIFQPVSGLIGYLSDLLPVNLSLIFLGISLIFCFGFLYALFKKRWKLAACLIPAPILILNALTIQMATGFILWPSWFRDIKTPLLAEKFPLTQGDKDQLLKYALKEISSSFSVTEWETLNQNLILEDANQSLDSLLKDLGFASGRTVRAIKDFHEPFFSLGLAYGGPAYQDPYTQEVVIPSQYPASKFWYWHCLYHEVAHAKGWLNELDTTLLQVASMIRSRYPTIRSLGWMHIILSADIYQGKSQAELVSLGLPEPVLSDMKMASQNIHELLQKKPLYQGLSKLLRQASIQNSPQKYGLDHEEWLNNPLNGMLFTLLSKGHLRYPE